MFHNYCSKVIQNLNIPRENSKLNTHLCINPVLTVVEKYKHHQSIISINKKMREKDQPKFSFHFVTFKETLKKVTLLNDKKSS